MNPKVSLDRRETSSSMKGEHLQTKDEQDSSKISSLRETMEMDNGQVQGGVNVQQREQISSFDGPATNGTLATLFYSGGWIHACLLFFPFLALLSIKIAWEEERKENDTEQHEGKHFSHARIALLVGVLLLVLFLWVFYYRSNQKFARINTRMTPSDSTVALIPDEVGTDVSFRYCMLHKTLEIVI